MTLHPLRLAVGDEDFFAILRRWARPRRRGNVTTDEFIALAERMSGEELGDLFDAGSSRGGQAGADLVRRPGDGPHERRGVVDRGPAAEDAALAATPLFTRKGVGGRRAPPDILGGG